MAVTCDRSVRARFGKVQLAHSRPCGAGAPTGDHFARSQRLLREIGGHGFPTFALETGQHFEPMASAPFLGEPQPWIDPLAQPTTARAG